MFNRNKVQEVVKVFSFFSADKIQKLSCRDTEAPGERSTAPPVARLGIAHHDLHYIHLLRGRDQETMRPRDHHESITMRP